MNKISEYNSRKIKALSFVAILMVLYIHAVYIEASDFALADYIQQVCAFSGLSFIANPFFFCVSGFLFFCGVQQSKQCYPKIKKRIRTLLIPYAIWNLIFVLWYVVLGIIPNISQFVNGDIIGEITNNGFLHGVYALFIAPVGFHLWFVRDLFIYVLISPLIYVCIRKFNLLLPLILFIFSSIGLMVVPSEIKIWGLFFFVLGAYIAVHSSLEKVQQWIKPFMAYICLAVYLLNAIIRPLNTVSLTGTDVFIEFCGLVAIWKLYDIVYTHKMINGLISKIAILGSGSFFIYLFHEPTFNIIKKLGLSFFGVHSWALILLYFINPFIMVIVAICISNVLKKYIPRFYSLSTGGR